MKKLMALFLALMMMASALLGCSAPATGPDNGASFEGGGEGNRGDAGSVALSELDKASAVRLLLAEERLNAALLKNQGDVFENGASVMLTLAEKALASVARTDEDQSMQLMSASYDASSEQVIFDNEHGGGRVTFDGERYLFSDFAEISNSYDSFESTARYIARMAEDAAKLIDDIKKNVRIVDKWVVIGGFTEYYLHVGENEEILYQRIDGRIDICRRYINEDGNNVYEFLTYGEEIGFVDRLTYIPGLHFETARGTYTDGTFKDTDYLICDNTKGYWEAYWVGPHPTHVNISYMMMKDDICYDSFYDSANGRINFLKIISADKTSDIFWYQGDESTERVEFNLHFSGFNSIKGVLADEIMFSDMGGDIGEIPQPIGREPVTLLLMNGTEIRVGDTFLDGKVSVSAIRTTMSYPNYAGELALVIEAPTVSEKLALFREFLNELGFTSRHDIDTVIMGVERAFDELREITKYHVWNGLQQATEDNVRRAAQIEDQRTVEFLRLYDAVKDAPRVDFDDEAAVELNAHFAEVTVSAHRDIVHAGIGISIGSLTLSVSDTLLFIEDQAYTVSFALASEDGLVHLEKKAGGGVMSFAKGDSFSVTVEDVRLEIPALTDGEYRLVAYIATDDGIRSSACTAFAFDTVEEHMEGIIGKTKLAVQKTADGGLVLIYTVIADVHTTLSYGGTLTYEELYALIAGVACEYGIPDGAMLEICSDVESGVFTAMTGEETVITDGKYRLAYNMQNGEKTVNGYIYVTLTLTPGGA